MRELFYENSISTCPKKYSENGRDILKRTIFARGFGIDGSSKTLAKISENSKVLIITKQTVEGNFCSAWKSSREERFGDFAKTLAKIKFFLRYAL
jgi:hypothetical protein